MLCYNITSVLNWARNLKRKVSPHLTLWPAFLSTSSARMAEDGDEPARRKKNHLNQMPAGITRRSIFSSHHGGASCGGERVFHPQLVGLVWECVLLTNEEYQAGGFTCATQCTSKFAGWVRTGPETGSRSETFTVNGNGLEAPPGFWGRAGF